MRVMAKITVPVESGNQAVKDGSIGMVMQRAAERWKPEAMYFTEFDGRRTAFIVFDLPDSSDIVPFAEPFFQELDANVQMSPVMNGEDLQNGLGKLGLGEACLAVVGEQRHACVTGLRLQLDPRRSDRRDRTGCRPATRQPAADRLRAIRAGLPELWRRL
jgi:hypothetical protein